MEIINCDRRERILVVILNRLNRDVLLAEVLHEEERREYEEKLKV